MSEIFPRVRPKFIPPLDPDFRPAVLVNRVFQAEVAAAGGVPLVLGIEREGGTLARFETAVFPDGHPHAEANLQYAERLVKFLLWQRGGWKVYVGGPANVGEYIQQVYSPAGARKFDYHFMGEEVYEHPFTVVVCTPSEVPPADRKRPAAGPPSGRLPDRL